MVSHMTSSMLILKNVANVSHVTAAKRHFVNIKEFC